MSAIGGVKDLESCLNLYERGADYVSVGDYVEVRQGGMGPNAEIRFVGPHNGGRNGDHVSVVCPRDFASVGFFFLGLAEKCGYLGDVSKAIKELLGVEDKLKGTTKDVAKG